MVDQAILDHYRARGIKLLASGRPGTAKTGSLCALLEAGFKVRLLSTEENLAPLFTYTEPSALRENLEDIVIVRERLTQRMLQVKDGRSTLNISRVMPVDGPTVFRTIMRLCDAWKHQPPGGTDERPIPPVDLGPVNSWPQDRVLVIDHLTGVGRGAARFVEGMRHRHEFGLRKQDWGEMQAEIAGFLDKLTAEAACHVIVFAHTKMIGPPAPEAKEDDAIREHKDKLKEQVGFRLFPDVPGQDLAKKLAGFFPYSVYFEADGMGRRWMHTQSTATYDVKCPVKGLPRKVPAPLGLLAVFKPEEYKRKMAEEGKA